MSKYYISEAAISFRTSARLLLAHDKDSKCQAATNFAVAAECFLKVDLLWSIDCWLKVAEIYTEIVRNFFWRVCLQLTDRLTVEVQLL
jgi:hypothetical protein